MPKSQCETRALLRRIRVARTRRRGGRRRGAAQARRKTKPPSSSSSCERQILLSRPELELSSDGSALRDRAEEFVVLALVRRSFFVIRRGVQSTTELMRQHL